MNILISTRPASQTEADWLIVPAVERSTLEGELATLNTALAGQIERVRDAQDFTGKSGETLTLSSPAGVPARRVLLLGLGPSDKVTVAALNRAITAAARIASLKSRNRVAVLLTGTAAGNLSLGQQVQLAASALTVGCVGQELFKSEKKRQPFSEIELLVPVDSNQAELSAAAQQGQIVGEAINLVRELVNLPADVIYPASFAGRAAALAGPLGVHCEVLEQETLEREKMGSLLAVARGSDRPARLVFLEYRGTTDPGAKVLALVGKGVTFDSGGLSLKPTDGMLTMKCDMAGAATALAVVIAIARLKLPVHVIGLMGLVENMTGGLAMKLGDVLHSRAGVTIEVQNTDAEGRLVLADVLDYAISRGADYIVDLATLTGACVVALGEEVVGAMSNNQAWCDRLLAAAQAAGEDAWQLPMFSHYDELIKSDVADIRNVGGRWGGAITAAKFLERFVKDKPWIHLDIAGPAFAATDKPHRDGGGTGVMVRTLLELARTMQGECAGTA